MKLEGLAVLRDVARSEPMRSDIYELALPVAVALENAEHVQWISYGILSQAWPDEKVALIEQAKLALKPLTFA